MTRSQEYIGEEGKRSPTRLTGKKIRGYKKEKSTNQEDRRCGVVRAVSGCEEEGVITKGSRKHQTIIMIVVMVMMIIMVDAELNMLLLSSTKQAQSLSYDAKTPVTQA